MSTAACRQVSPRTLELSAIASDLAALCRQGLLEAFEDEHGEIRYRLTSLGRTELLPDAPGVVVRQ